MQVKNSFDRETLIKVGRGALIAGTGAVALYLFDWIGTIDVGTTWTPLIGAVVPFLINAVKEWMKGQ